MKLGGKFSENDYQIQQTDFLLETYGQLISLHRLGDFADDSAGGVIRGEDDGTLAEQRFWFFEASPIAHIARGTNLQDTIGMGQRILTNYVLVGESDANMKQGDTFELEDGFTYKVMYVHPNREFMTLGEVERVAQPIHP